MICLICRQAEILDRLTDIKFQRGKIDLVINNVPARVCPSCGEEYLAEDVAARLLESAQDVIKAGELESHLEYSTT
jgi:YgiT-type zinc finger domain-containing protein